MKTLSWHPLLPTRNARRTSLNCCSCAGRTAYVAHVLHHQHFHKVHMLCDTLLSARAMA